jgi:multicomponent Na+:H+ antiporter subunit D
MSAPQTWLLVALAVPFAAALLIGAFRRHPNLREGVTLAAAVVLLVSVVVLLEPVLAGSHLSLPAMQVAPGLTLAFAVEPLGMLFALIASALWVVNSLYSIGYMRANAEPHQTRFYVCFAIALGSTIGVAFSANLFTLLLFYEALTLSTYPLVVHRGDAAAMRAGRHYIGLLLGTSMVLLLPAIVLTWALAGTLDFAPGGTLAGKVGEAGIAALLALYVFGIGKAAVMPLHSWLPAAMVAPTPVSALLHAVAVVKAGVFAILKVVVFVFGIDVLAAAGQSQWLTIVASITILLASLAALQQDDLKRRLAYSTVSQLSYVVLGIAILTPASVIGAAIHIAAHAFGKITLFFAAGSIYTAAHLTKVSELDGIGRRMPWTMGAFAIGALGMIGIPPTAGFVGKWFILTGAMQASNWTAAVVIAVSTLLNAAYFLPIVVRAFFMPPTAATERVQVNEAAWPIVVALALTAAGTIVLFLVPDIPLALARQMVGG